ncbi:hypothetical protein NFI96_012275 [Prochilodus magdalenae]|nr:hypothetical protein NFI96_012275 [Prochilodus magdalenae]
MAFLDDDFYMITVDEIKEALAYDDMPAAVSKINDYFAQQDHVELNIAVTGESGSGKSTFINAFRGMGDEDEGSAATGVVETTKVPTNYPHPKYPNVKLWDLPGIGTPNFKADEYLKQVEFERYDFFIIIASDRFRECHTKLAAEIVNMGKKFYFVRSKIDNSISAEQRKKTFNKEKTLQDIRNDCIEGLKEAGVDAPAVFLISCFDLSLYDFTQLEETMEKELPQHKRHVLMLALPNITLDINERKKKELQKDIWKLALASAGVAAIPILILNATLSIAVDTTILVTQLKRYYNAFSVDPASLQRLSERSEKSVDELKAVMKSPLHAEINKDLVVKLLAGSTFGALEAAAEYWLGLIPGLGSLVAGEKTGRIKPMETDSAKALDLIEMEFLDNNIDVITVEDIQETLAHEDMPAAVSKIKDYFAQQDRVELNIAVTGESGSGKSSFINAFRGMGDEDEGSAATGVVETTKFPTAYAYPKYPNVKLWDLPGIGTPNFKADEYLKQVEFERYDFFIIIASDRFRECHTKLAAEIVNMGKKFYFVRSKIDNSISAEQRKKTFNKEKTLQDIRNDCIKGLKEAGIDAPAVFLISCFDLALYDFTHLEDTMEKELPQHKRHVLMLALPNISLEINERKKKELQKDIWKLALLSAGVAAIPIPILNATLSIAVDTTILVTQLKRYYNAFSVDPASLKRLSVRSGKSVDELKAVMKSPLHAEINKDLVVKLLVGSAFGAAEIAVEYWLGFIPGLGSLVSGPLSFATVYFTLKCCLDGLAKDARNVLMAALPTPV